MTSRYPSMKARTNSSDIMLTITNVEYCLTRQEADDLIYKLRSAIRLSIRDECRIAMKKQMKHTGVQETSE